MKRLLIVAVACLTVSACLAAASVASAQDKLTYVDLVKRLTDLERLAVLPTDGEFCAQASSYDRASTYDVATGKYVKWDANADGGGFIRKEGNQIVMAEMTGPGCIWRTWSARAQAGHVKIYLDGAAEPAVDLPFDGYFNGKNAPFVYPSLVNTTASGRNCYVPIPYQKSCKIVADLAPPTEKGAKGGDLGWGAYYHFTYETFPRGTVVPTFRRELSEAETAALKAADEFLSGKLGTDPAGPRQMEATARIDTTILAGGVALPVVQIDGAKAITSIRVTPVIEGADDPIAYNREMALRITWDGEKTPAVWAPLGDFFGTAPGINKYKSLPLGMTDDGYYSFWYMPFAKGAVVELVNDGKTARKIKMTVTHAPVATAADKLGRFHAKWHRDAFLPDVPERRIDWTMLKLTGAGRFVGVMLHVWNPKGGWWGEGDEKFFVDGEKFPSTFGTGSEDYFGYAWSSDQLFQNCFHNQTFCARQCAGHVSVNRWHITDNVPFHTSFEGDIEKYYPNSKPTLYACTAYWYQAAGQADPYEAVPVDQRVGYWSALPPAAPPAPSRARGALEGEALEIISKTAGQTQVQDTSGFSGNWSGSAHLWWTGAKPDDKLELAVPVAEAGTYKVTARLTKAKDYATVKVGLDDAAPVGPIDLYDPEVVLGDVVDLGTVKLTAGRHKLVIQITGSNAQAVKAYMVGLDYVRLEKTAE